MTDTTSSPAELDQAIAQITGQLDRLRAGPTLGEPSDDRALIAELSAELDALRRMRADRD